MTYATDRETLNPIYDDCPNFCPETGEARNTFCEGCEIALLREQFKNEAVAELETMPGEKYGFDYLNQCVVDAMSIINSLPRSRWTRTTARFNAIIEGERLRIKRLKKWNEPKPPGNNAGE